MKVNIIIKRMVDDSVVDTIYGVSSFHYDLDHHDLVVYSWGLVNYIKHLEDKYFEVVVVHKDNSSLTVDEEKK